MRASECLSQEDVRRLRMVCKIFNAQEVIFRQDQHFPEHRPTFREQYAVALSKGERVCPSQS